MRNSRRANKPAPRNVKDNIWLPWPCRCNCIMFHHSVCHRLVNCAQIYRPTKSTLHQRSIDAESEALPAECKRLGSACHLRNSESDSWVCGGIVSRLRLGFRQVSIMYILIVCTYVCSAHRAHFQIQGDLGPPPRTQSDLFHPYKKKRLIGVIYTVFDDFFFLQIWVLPQFTGVTSFGYIWGFWGSKIQNFLRNSQNLTETACLTQLGPI